MRYRFEPAIFASAPLDKRDWRWHLTSAFSQRLRKYTFTAVHTKTHRRRFQIYPLWRAFSNLCVYGERFHRLRVDGRPKCIKKFAFTRVCVYNRLRVDGALDWLRLSLDSEDNFRTGCWSASRKQQSFLGLQSPRWSFAIKVCYSWVQIIFGCFVNLWL